MCLRYALVFWESEPQYDYKRYAYMKIECLQKNMNTINTQFFYLTIGICFFYYNNVYKHTEAHISKKLSIF